VEQKTRRTHQTRITKEKANVSVDKKRRMDLEQLKVFRGPFTASEQVDLYIQKGNINKHTNIDRLYPEVRYSRDTSLSVPKTSDILG